MNDEANKIIESTENMNNPDRHSDDINDLITKIPAWILRWGISLFFLILAAMMGVTLIVKYPNTVKAKWSVASAVHIGNVNTKLASRIIQVAVKPGQFVKKGQLLAITTVEDKESNTDSLVAPIAGKIGFANILETGILTTAGELMFVVHPRNNHLVITIAIAPQFKYMVESGQDVQINLDNFSPRSNQSIKGIITKIAEEPDLNGFFIGKVEPDHVKDINLILKTWMHGEAEIYTENLSIAERIYRSFIFL